MAKLKLYQRMNAYLVHKIDSLHKLAYMATTIKDIEACVVSFTSQYFL